MGKIIAVANQKGGVGKTTTAINLSAALGEKGKKTLLIDLDSQGNATSGVGVEKNETENTSYELIMGEATFKDCLKSEVFPKLDLIPSNSDLTAAEIQLLEEDDRETKLKNILDDVKNDYEFIIIDCPPSLNMLTINAMVAADSVLIPIQCEYYALEGLSQLLQTIEFVQERANNKLKIEGIVFTMYDPRVRLSGQVVQNVRRNLSERTFRTLIPRNVRLAEAPSHGKPVMYYARLCSGTRAYRNLSKEIIALYETEKASLKLLTDNEETEKEAIKAGDQPTEAPADGEPVKEDAEAPEQDEQATETKPEIEAGKEDEAAKDAAEENSDKNEVTEKSAESDGDLKEANEPEAEAEEQEEQATETKTEAEAGKEDEADKDGETGDEAAEGSSENTSDENPEENVDTDEAPDGTDSDDDTAEDNKNEDE